MTPTPATREAEPATGKGGAVPRHVAIIMDGNGRWAESKGLPRVAGHRAGAEAVRKAIRAAADAGVDVLTLYAFSSENWRRSDEEIADLTGLMRFYLDRELKTLEKEGVRLQLIGNPSAFGPDLSAQLQRAVDRTATNRRLTLVIALNYGSRAEIAAAARKLAAERAPEDIDEDALDAAMMTSGLPPLDLLIRTSGEVRLSNFLLWQAAYAELLFLDVMWPDFDEAVFDNAVEQFAGRKRRYGGR